MGPAIKCFRESNLVSVAVFEIFRVKILTVHLLTLWGLPLGPKSPKGETTYYPPRSTIVQNFSPIAQTIYEICITKVSHLLAPWGLTPGPKFTKKGDDLVDSEIYHPAKFHRSMPTHARDIRYQNPPDRTTNKKTVTDIYPPCPWG